METQQEEKNKKKF